EHWQGHRGLTRRTIEAFPEEHLFTYSIGGMRPFGKMVNEMIRMAVPTLEGVVSGSWQDDDRQPVSKEGQLGPGTRTPPASISCGRRSPPVDYRKRTSPSASGQARLTGS